MDPNPDNRTIDYRITQSADYNVGRRGIIPFQCNGVLPMRPNSLAI